MDAALTHLQFGAFSLVESVGKGGMGEVFKALHLAEQVPVAIKVMMARRARDPRFREAFRQEVRAVARLEHPGIIMVFDCGEVSPELEARSAGRMVAGSAWLAMELARYSLQDIDKGALDWWHIKNILMRILDALAHSHARGVIHRDLKPANVLFVQSADGVQLKLTDFGLAHALDDMRSYDDLGNKVSGTPRFMAPEQITGKWREQGPWTDLYSLGCMAYWLASGEPPFYTGNTEQILRGHLYEALPPLDPVTPLPRGFKTWLEGLLAKDALVRYRRAADAARDLLRLGDPPGLTSSRRPLTMATLRVEGYDDSAVQDMGMTEILGDVLTLANGGDQGLNGGSVRSSQDLAKGTSGRDQAPHPVPVTWRRKEVPQRSMALAGVGCGLFGLRQIPFVNRVSERDRLWEALREVSLTRRPRAIALSGLAGTGKSRLAEWVAERAHEVGAATILTAHHSPIAGPADGVGRMIANHLRCVGQSREQILDRVRALIGEDGPLNVDDLHECMALTELIAPAADPNYDESNARVRFRAPKERHIVFQRFLARLCTRRPVLLVFDDIQWSDESLAYIDALFEPQVLSELPVLTLMTLGQEALASQPMARRQFKALETRPEVEHLSVTALAENDQRQLINHLLGLQSELVETVVERTRGNPLFAVQLVGDWIERGVLAPGKDGFHLRPGEEAWLPDDMHQVMRERIGQVVGQDLNEPAQDALIALELAAALGQDVERREWEYLCRLRGVRLPLLVLDAMVASRLAYVSGQGWAFSQGAFRESLEGFARKEGRYADHHGLAAKMLADFYGPGHPGVCMRVARHFFEAAAYEEALEPILRACEDARVRCDFEPGAQLHDLYEQCLYHLEESTMDQEPIDRHRIRGWLSRARTLCRQGKLEDAIELLDRADPLARDRGWQEELANILLIRGGVYKERAQISEGIALGEEARAFFNELDDFRGQTQSVYLLAELFYWAGSFTQSLAYYLRALEGFERLEEHYDAAIVKMSLGALYPKLGQPEAGIASLEQAMKAFETYGDSNALANCLNSLGDLNRFAGRLARAEVYYQKALRILERIGLYDDVIISVNLGLTLLAQEKYGEADRIFQDILEQLSKSGRKGYIGLAHVCNLPTSAVSRDWRRWDFHIREAQRYLAESGIVDTDLARVADLAAQLASEAKQPERAEAARSLARSQLALLEQPGRA